MKVTIQAALLHGVKQVESMTSFEGRNTGSDAPGGSAQGRSWPGFSPGWRTRDIVILHARTCTVGVWGTGPKHGQAAGTVGVWGPGPEPGDHPERGDPPEPRDRRPLRVRGLRAGGLPL